MHKCSLFGLLALAVFVAGCKSDTNRAQGPAKTTTVAAPAVPRPPADKAGAPHARPVDIGAFEVVKLSFQLGTGAAKPGPAAKPGAGAGANSRAPRGGAQGRRGRGGGGMGGHGGGCPQTELGGLLGVTFAQPHGCIVGSVRKDSPIAKAGLKVGDSIVGCNGSEVTCPSTFLPALFSDGKPGNVSLTIHRPKHGRAGQEKSKQPAPKAGDK